MRPDAGREYCNVLARASGLDPAGHAGSFRDLLLVETPLPWRRSVYEAPGALPQQAIDLLGLWLRRYNAGQPYDHYLQLIAPDAAYSRPGYRRVLYFSRPPGAFAHFTRIEYLAPEAEAGPLIWALYEAPTELAAFAPYQVQTLPAAGAAVRDLLVCTHGTVDVACSKFGYPLYRQLRDKYADDHLHVWRVSHFGGHVFAPTVMDMPSGHYWAFVGDAQAEQVVRRGSVAALRPHLRGWAGMERGFDQALDCAIWQREGWSWFDAAKHSKLLACDPADDPQWAVVRIAYTRPDGASGAYTAHVDVTHWVETKASTQDKDSHAYPQYAVAELRHEEGEAPTPTLRHAGGLQRNEIAYG